MKPTSWSVFAEDSSDLVDANEQKQTEGSEVNEVLKEAKYLRETANRLEGIDWLPSNKITSVIPVKESCDYFQVH